MKYLILGGLILLGVILFIRCKTTAKNQPAEVKEESVSLLFSLKKSSCRGKCEVYDFSVDAKGNALYTGIRNVDKIGTYSSTLSAQQLENLQNLLKEKSVESFSAEYPVRAADMQKFTMSYLENSTRFQRKDGPKDLFPVIDAIDALIKELDWKG